MKVEAESRRGGLVVTTASDITPKPRQPHVPKDLRWRSLGRRRFYADVAAMPESIQSKRESALLMSRVIVVTGLAFNVSAENHHRTDRFEVLFAHHNLFALQPE